MINRNNFILEDIPMYHPESLKYLDWWRDQKKKCIEGYWSSGYWMPGNLYFYINFGTILVNKTEHATSKEPGRPLLRDLEWEFFYNWAESRGFSGFILDEEYTCNRNANPSTYSKLSDFERNRFIRTTPNAFKPNGMLKTYVEARDYLRKQHPRALGYPLFENMSKDMMMLGCHSIGTKVRLHSGEIINIEDVTEEHSLLGPDGLPRKVKNIIRGFGKMYEVHQTKANNYIVSEDHIMVLKDRKGELKERKVKDLLKLKLDKDNVIPSWKGLQSECIPYSEKELPIDPYIMGMWLGDGALKSGIITNSDQEIIEYLISEYPEASLYHNNYSKNARRENFKVNLKVPFLTELRKLNLTDKKYIPDVYLYSSKEQRLQLLAGLLDSDGCLDGNVYDFYQKDKELLEQVKLLCLSLGFSATISMGKKRDIGKVHITGELTLVPSKLERKVAKTNTKKYTSGIRFEYLGEQAYFGVELDGDHRYVLEDYTIAHNSRGFGKSYSVGVGIILHEWLFDGQTKYIPAAEQKVAPKSVTVVGAGDGKYSTDLLLKTSFALDFLPGNQQIGNKYYPCPFTKKFKGSWNTNNNIIAKYKKKVGGEWKNLGTFSEIKHRSFKDNPFAANGIRAGAMIFEEIGMFDNLIAARNASVECQQDGAIKFGSMMFLGTGGDMDRGTIDASIMFNDPEGFNLLQFDDVWENRGKIGYFVPAYRGLNQYKDENGFTIEEPARQYLEGVRKTLRESKSGSSAIDEELQNRPLVPSEVFLTKKGNLFPIDSLRKRQVSLESDDNYKLLEKPIELFFDKELPGGVGYKLDLESNLRPLNNFPLTDKQKSNRNGCVVIYEFPIEIDGVVPKDMYLIGHDPYASDDPDGESLGAIYVIKNKKYISKGYDEIVASFIGRPEQGRWVVNENLYKLSLFYGGCKIYFENIRGNTLEYFEKIRRLDLLAAQPETILNKKSATRKSGSTIYGYPMSNDKMKAEGVLYLRDWLVEERGTGVKGEVIRNLDLIPDKALLQELIAFNYTGNFDRVMAFMGCMFGLEESHNRYVRHVDSDTKNTLDFLHNNRLIRNKKKPIIEDDHNE